jgi:pilus assembly protein CpaF
MFTVVVQEKEGGERRMTFTEPEVTIGRVPGNDVVLPKGNVSKRHSRIVLKDNRFIVVDLKSTNGTYVNGRKITSPLVVKEGDKIYVGDYVLTLEGAPALDALRPPSLLAPDSSNGKPLLTPIAPPLPARGEDEAEGESLMPAVLRGGLSPSSLPPTVASESEEPAAVELGGDEDEPILPAESELEVFEERSPQSQERLQDAFAEVRMPPIPPLGKRAARTLELSATEGLLGPIDEVLADPSVIHVVVERFDRIRADRGQGLVLENTSFDTPDALVKAAWDVGALAGVPSAAASYDVSLANGLHVVAVMPAGASNGPVISVRRRPGSVHTLAQLEEGGAMSGAVATRLEEALRKKRHVWVVAVGGADAASFSSGLLAAAGGDERIALFERAPEIALGERSSICLKLGAVPLAELLERVRVFRPERLVLHGLRDDELPVALDAFARRNDGSVAVVEARSAKDALAAFERAVGADIVLRAVSLLVELRREDGKTHASAFHIEADASGEPALKPL